MLQPGISVFTTEPATALNIEDLQHGISQRLELLTYLFCPDDEVEPGIVLDRLRVETTNGQVIIRWRPRMRYPMRICRFGEELSNHVASAQFGLSWYNREEAKVAHEILDAAVDGVGFFHGFSRDDMGWPIAIAAAATIASKNGGAIDANEEGWLIPIGLEVKSLFPPGLDVAD